MRAATAPTEAEACRQAAEKCWMEAHNLIQATGYHRRDKELAELRAALDAASAG